MPMSLARRSGNQSRRRHRSFRFVTRFLEDASPVKRGRVDWDAGVIRGVKVLGFDSDNGRRYLPQAVKEGAGLYEGIQVNANHPKRPDDPRDVNDRFGWLQDAEVKAAGLYADLHILVPESDLGQAVMAAAEQKPDLFGLSHNAEGAGYTDTDGTFVIEQITEVLSVDLVDRPATNKTLFEGRRGMRRKMTVSEMTNLDADIGDHLYAAHKKANSAGNYDVADRIIGVLKKIGAGTSDDKNLNPDEDEEAGLKEEDNLDMKIDEDDDDDKDGKPSPNDPEPDDLKKKGDNPGDPDYFKNHLVKESRGQAPRTSADFARALKDDCCGRSPNLSGPRRKAGRRLSEQRSGRLPRNADEFAAALFR